MTRPIERLLRQARVQSARNSGPVPVDTMMNLAAEGYELAALEDDLEEGDTDYYAA